MVEQRGWKDPLASTNNRANGHEHNKRSGNFGLDEVAKILYAARQELLDLWRNLSVREILRKRKVKSEEGFGCEYPAAPFWIPAFAYCDTSFLDSLERSDSARLCSFGWWIFSFSFPPPLSSSLTCIYIEMASSELDSRRSAFPNTTSTWNPSGQTERVDSDDLRCWWDSITGMHGCSFAQSREARRLKRWALSR
jgi:hypothetical protein